MGVVHKVALGQGPAELHQFFIRAAPSRFLRRRHRYQIYDWRVTRPLSILRRSVLGLTWVYNLLPQNIVALDSVPDFQSALQELVMDFCRSRHPHWSHCLSPRLAYHSHPLLSL